MVSNRLVLGYFYVVFFFLLQRSESTSDMKITGHWDIRLVRSSFLTRCLVRLCRRFLSPPRPVWTLNLVWERCSCAWEWSRDWFLVVLKKVVWGFAWTFASVSIWTGSLLALFPLYDAERMVIMDRIIELLQRDYRSPRISVLAGALTKSAAKFASKQVYRVRPDSRRIQLLSRLLTKMLPDKTDSRRGISHTNRIRFRLLCWQLWTGRDREQLIWSAVPNSKHTL